jgi:hypothetical protein
MGFPLLGAVSFLAVGGPFWQWVDGVPISIHWSHLLRWPTLWWALGSLIIPAIWWLGLRFSVRRRWILLGALGLVWGLDLLLRTSLLQVPLWLAARARLDPRQDFMREVCYVRLEENGGRQGTQPAVVLVGSSQVLNGVDTGLLRELLAPVPVLRRAMFGMTPLKALAMSSYMPFRAEDQCVLYLSEFDFTNQDEFPFAWFRPYASWQTLPSVLQCMAYRTQIWYWRRVTDYMLAATVQSWQARDFLQQIVFHFWAPATESRVPENDDVKAVLVTSARAELKQAPAEEQAFLRFAKRLAARKVDMVIFEGDVNPAIYSPSRNMAKKQVRDFLIKLTEAYGQRYVSQEEQGLDLDAGDWKDMSHLNPGGREKLTRRMAEVLSEDSNLKRELTQ